MNKIRQLLQCDLTDPADRTRYLIACLILNETLR